jgi:hypothetical protein
MSSRGERHHGTRSGQPSCDDSLSHHDASTSRVREPYFIVSYPLLICLDHSLDHIANKIASATFQVLNAGRVKTADMGGESWCLQRVAYSINSPTQARQPLLSLRLQ